MVTGYRCSRVARLVKSIQLRDIDDARLEHVALAFVQCDVAGCLSEFQIGRNQADNNGLDGDMVNQVVLNNFVVSIMHPNQVKINQQIV